MKKPPLNEYVVEVVVTLRVEAHSRDEADKLGGHVSRQIKSQARLKKNTSKSLPPHSLTCRVGNITHIRRLLPGNSIEGLDDGNNNPDACSS